MTKQILLAEFLRAQAAWRLARADGAPVRAARCAAALLDAAAYAAALTEDDEDLAALARGGCFRGSLFDPGARGITIARSWQFGDPPHAGPRDLLTTLAAVAGRRVGVLGGSCGSSAVRMAASITGRHRPASMGQAPRWASQPGMMAG